eukprot:8644032-Pyramimonas_sp.AAC.1
MMERIPDSAPRPDGIPFSGWARAGDTATRTLYSLYLHILQAGSTPLNTNDAMAVFLAKGDEPADASF